MKASRKVPNGSREAVPTSRHLECGLPAGFSPAALSQIHEISAIPADHRSSLRVLTVNLYQTHAIQALPPGGLLCALLTPSSIEQNFSVLMQNDSPIN